MSEGNTFGLNISVKTLMMIQILLVWSLVIMEIFLEEVRLDYIIPLYTLIWIMTYSDISNTEKAGREEITRQTVFIMEDKSSKISFNYCLKKIANY